METCPGCGVEAAEQSDRCLSCHQDLGAPNVRVAGSTAERKALEARVANAKQKALREGRDAAVNAFASAAGDSHVVVAIPSAVLYNLLSNPSHAYVNYEILVDAEVRPPSSIDDDAIRRAVGGAIFGSYANKIRYGCLSLSGRGLHSYGGYACCLADSMIMTRVSFLEENSFKVVPGANIINIRSKIAGRRSVWDNRADLCTAKLADQILPSHDTSDWQSLLVFCEGDRDSDRFVEAHIFGPFTANSISSIVRVDSRPRNAMDNIVDELWAKLRGAST